MMNRTLMGILAVILIGGLALGGYALARNGGDDPTPTAINTDEPTVTDEPSADPPLVTDEPTTEAAPSADTDTPTPTNTATPTPTATPTHTPQPADAVTQEPATFTPILTTEAPQDVCAAHGGVQWAGETCICPGKIDQVRICTDGTQFDNLTDRICTPTTSCSGGSSGGSGGDGGSGGTELCPDGTPADPVSGCDY